MLRVMPREKPGEDASHFFICIEDFLGKNLVINVRVASCKDTLATASQEGEP